MSPRRLYIQNMQLFLNDEGANLAVSGLIDNATKSAMQDWLDGTLHRVDKPSGDINHVVASSFADPADIRSFRQCKSEGFSDQHCFRVGDNGIGRWGDDTTTDVPMCALPPEIWREHPSPRGAKVLVTYNGKEIVTELRDTMPRLRNITNGAGIDLNYAACKALGLEPPIMIDVTWQWAY